MGWTVTVDQEPRVARSTRLGNSAQQPRARGLCCGTSGSPRLTGENPALEQETQ